MRVGVGMDAHALARGRPLIVGGVEVPYDRGLEGHSDADVLTHAIMDALLGAAGLGDIGRLFPDTDPAYKDISSVSLLRDVAGRVAGKGYRIINVDAVVMAQEPRLSPYREEMERLLAEAMGINEGQVSVKATTTEGMGFVGRKEGMAALAVALLEEIVEDHTPS